jgi:hypothetical protein
MEFVDKVTELKFKGKTAEEIAHILDTDAGRVRIVMEGHADPCPDTDEYELVDIPEDDEVDEGPIYGDDDDDMELGVDIEEEDEED